MLGFHAYGQLGARGCLSSGYPGDRLLRWVLTDRSAGASAHRARPSRRWPGRGAAYPAGAEQWRDHSPQPGRAALRASGLDARPGARGRTPQPPADAVDPQRRRLDGHRACRNHDRARHRRPASARPPGARRGPTSLVAWCSCSVTGWPCCSTSTLPVATWHRTTAWSAPRSPCASCVRRLPSPPESTFRCCCAASREPARSSWRAPFTTPARGPRTATSRSTWPRYRRRSQPPSCSVPARARSRVPTAPRRASSPVRTAARSFSMRSAKHRTTCSPCSCGR